MRCCTFFGHRDCSAAVEPLLRQVILSLLDEGYDYFLVGNHGQFDRLVQRCLKELSERHRFDYAIVLEQLPEAGAAEVENSILAEGVEDCPFRFRIDRRNEWMLQKADAVVCYVWRRVGGAAKFVEKARRQEKRIIYLYEE